MLIHSRFLPAIIVAFLAITTPVIAKPAKKPVLAVFTIQARRVKISSDTLLVLSDYLATKLTATGAYQVVPRDLLKKRLGAQKRNSYKRCYDQSCQIEIGRELVANNSFAQTPPPLADVRSHFEANRPKPTCPGY